MNTNQQQLLNTAKLLNSEYRILLKRYSDNFRQEQKNLITSLQSKTKSLNSNINANIKQSGAFEDSIISIKPDKSIIQSELINEPELIKSEQKTFNLLDKFLNIFEKQKTGSELKDNTKSQTNTTFINEQQQDQLVDIAVSLTDGNHHILDRVDYSVSQIGDHQIWQDKNDIAIINSKNNQLVVYGEVNRDFFPTKVQDSDLKKLNVPERLLSKITQVNPAVRLQSNPQEIAETHLKFQPIDPVAKALNQPQNQSQSETHQQLSSSVKNILNIAKQNAKNVSDTLASKFEKLVVDNLDKANSWIKQKSQSIVARQLSNRLMKHSFRKFWQGHQRTEENKYSVGNYKIERSTNGKYNLRDANDKLLISFECGRQSDASPVLRRQGTSDHNLTKLQLTSNSQKPHLINEALNEVSNPQIQSKGSPKQEKKYQAKIANILEQLSSYTNNFNVIRNSKSVISLQKSNDGLTIRDENGKLLISANSQGINTSISSEKINSIDQLLKSHFQQQLQQQQVEEIAPLLKKFLDLNETNIVNRDNLLVSFDPQTESIFYQDKKQPENKLSALLTQDGWKNISTNISPEKQEYFSQVVAPKIEQLTQQKHQHSHGIISENQNSTKRRGRSR